MDDEILKICYGKYTKLQLDSSGIIIYAKGLDYLFIGDVKGIDEEFIGKHIREFIKHCREKNVYLSASFYELVGNYLTKEDFVEQIKTLETTNKALINCMKGYFQSRKEVLEAISSGLDKMIETTQQIEEEREKDKPRLKGLLGRK